MTDLKTTDEAATEYLADKLKAPERERRTKMLMDKYPGHITWASDRANFSGCRLIRFSDDGVTGLEEEDAKLFEEELAEVDVGSAEAAANLYFSTRANLMVVDTKITDGAISMLVTTQLDDDDLEELQETQTRIQLGMREWREKRDEEREKERLRLADERRLIEVGRKAEEYGWVKKIRELEEKLAAKGG
jgi:hypothetical protein